MKKLILFTAVLMMNALVLNAEVKTWMIDGFLMEFDTDDIYAKVLWHESYADLETANMPSTFPKGDYGAFYVVSEIESGVFAGCAKLQSVKLPDYLQTIGLNDTFKGCTSLTSITIDSDNTKFSTQNGVLYNKNKDTILCCPPGKTGDLTIPNTVTTMANSTFEDGSKITTLTIPSALVNIDCFGWTPFKYCTNLTAFIVDPANPNFSSEDGVLFDKGKTQLYAYPASKAGAYTIPSTVTGMLAYSFFNSTGLTSVDIPSGVTELPPFAFAGCTGLQSITCHNTDNPVSVGQLAFGGSMEGLSYPAVDKSTCIVTVPSALMAAYKTANEWQDFAHIRGIYPFHYVDKEAQELGSESYILNVPDAPEIEGFTFLRWEPVAADIANGITIQAVYQSTGPTNAPEVYTNPTNPAQKLIRNGNVYVLSNGETYSITGQKVESRK